MCTCVAQKSSCWGLYWCSFELSDFHTSSSTWHTCQQHLTLEVRQMFLQRLNWLIQWSPWYMSRPATLWRRARDSRISTVESVDIVTRWEPPTDWRVWRQHCVGPCQAGNTPGLCSQFALAIDNTEDRVNIILHNYRSERREHSDTPQGDMEC